MEMYFDDRTERIHVIGRLVRSTRLAPTGSIEGDSTSTYRVAHDGANIEFSPLVALLGCLYAPEQQTRWVEVFARTPVGAWLLGGVADLNGALLEPLGLIGPDFTISLPLQRLRQNLSERNEDMVALNEWARLVLDLDNPAADDGAWTDEDAERAQAWAQAVVATIAPGVALDAVTLEALTLYCSDDLIALAAAEVVERSRHRHKLTICPLCKTPWIRSHASELFCGRPAPGEGIGGRTCKQRGAQVRHLEKIDPLTDQYRRAYRRLDKARMRNSISHEQLNEWRSDAKRIVEAVRATAGTPDDIIARFRTIEPTRTKGATP